MNCKKAVQLYRLIGVAVGGSMFIAEYWYLGDAFRRALPKAVVGGVLWPLTIAHDICHGW